MNHGRDCDRGCDHGRGFDHVCDRDRDFYRDHGCACVRDDARAHDRGLFFYHDQIYDREKDYGDTRYDSDRARSWTYAHDHFCDNGRACEYAHDCDHAPRDGCRSS